MNLISCLDAWQDGENVWLSNYDYNALIRWNMDSGEAEIMGLFPQEPEDAGRLHRRVFCVGKKLYFIPYRGRYIHIRDLEQGTWECVKVAEEEMIVADACFVEDCIWIFPCYLRWPIMLFHINTHQLERMDSLTEEIGNYIEEKYKDWMVLDISCVCQRGGFFYLAEYRRNRIFCIDDKGGKLQHVWPYVGVAPDWEDRDIGEEVKIQGITVCGKEDFWLASLEKAEVYRWNPKEGIKRTYGFAAKMYGKRIPFLRVVDVDELYALVLPCHSGYLFRIHKRTDEITKIPYPVGFARRRIYSLFCGYGKEAGKVFLYPRSGNGLLIVEVKKGEAFYIPYIFNEKDGGYLADFYLQSMREQLCSGKLDESEGGKDILSDFLDEVVCRERDMEQGEAEPIGKRIYEYCKETCLRGRLE